MENNSIMVRDNSIAAQMAATGQQMVADARALTIANDADYAEAGAVLRRIKEQTKKIKDYWAEPKARAKAAHQEIVDREKAMLKSLTDAETIIKGTMKGYVDAVEKAKREAEEEARRRQKEQADLELEAILFGDEMAHEAAQELVQKATPDVETPKAQGIGVRKQWKARVIDEKQVPAYSGDGYELRTINMAALNMIARMSKGAAVIPGIEFYEDTVISARQ